MDNSQKLTPKWIGPYKKLLIGAVLLGLLAGRGHVLSAQEQPRLSVIATENLGETLDHFRKTHRAALCRRSQFEEARTAHHNSEIWVTCSVDRDVSFVGYPLLSEVEPEYPFGLTVIFRDRKLIHLSYVLAPDSLELLLPAIIKQYGVPSKKLTDSDGFLSSASWTFGTSVLLLEKTPINSEVYEGEFVHITKTPERFAVTAHIFYQTNEARYPAVIQ